MTYVFSKRSIAIYFGYFGLKEYNNNTNSTNKRKRKLLKQKGGWFLFSVTPSHPDFPISLFPSSASS